MQLISIDVDKSIHEDILKYFKTKMERVKKVKFKMKSNGLKSNNLIIELDEFKLNSRTVENLKYNISNILAEYILNTYDIIFAKKVLTKNYKNLVSEEKKEIFCDFIEKKSHENFSEHFNIRKTRIVNLLLEHLKVSDEIILDGFVNFRLKDNKKYVEAFIRDLISEHLEKSEYNEFINLLKYFVDVQTPKVSIVQIMFEDEKGFVLLDAFNNRITQVYHDEFLEDFVDEDVNKNDLLISSLLTLAPLRVIVHKIRSFENSKIISSVENIFGSRVVLCKGCDFCDTF